MLTVTVGVKVLIISIFKSCRSLERKRANTRLIHSASTYLRIPNRISLKYVEPWSLFDVSFREELRYKPSTEDYVVRKVSALVSQRLSCNPFARDIIECHLGITNGPVRRWRKEGGRERQRQRDGSNLRC